MKNSNKKFTNLIRVGEECKSPLTYTQQKATTFNFFGFFKLYKISKSLKLSQALTSTSKLLALLAILSFSILATSCADKKEKDTTPPVLKTKLSLDKPIRSDQPIVLEFDEPITAQSVNQKNIILQDGEDEAINVKNYKVEPDAKDNKKIVITLINDELKSKTANYKLKLQNLSDAAGNKTQAKVMEFKWLDSVAPFFVDSSFKTGASLKSDTSLILTFSEVLKVETIKSNIILKDKDAKELSAEKYEVVQDAKNKTKVNVTLKDDVLKGQTADYTLEIKQGLTDDVGNKLKEAKTLAVKLLDSIAPIYSKNNLKIDNGSKSLSSSESLILEFSEAIKTDTVKTTNLVLENKNGVALSDQEYEVAQNEDKTKISVTLKTDALKNQTSNYTLKVKDLTDAEGNALATTIDPIKFIFKDEIKPSFNGTNLTDDNGKKKISSDIDLVLTFSEAINADTVNTTNIVLENTSKTKLTNAEYKVTQNSDKTKINVTLTDKDLKNQTAKYTLKISGVTDESGNELAAFTPIEFEFLDSIPLTYQSNDIPSLNEIVSTTPIVLTFSEPLSADVVNSTNFVLKQNGTEPIDSTKYEVTQSGNKVTIKLTDNALKNQGSEYTLSAKGLKDITGNPLAENFKLIKFRILDKIKPHIVENNLIGDAGDKRINSNKTLVLTFNEILDDTTVNNTNIVLQENDGTPVVTNKYEVKLDEKDKSKVNISLTDEALKKTTTSYKLKISGVKDIAKNLFVYKTGQVEKNEQIIEFKFMENIPPKFLSSNIFGKKIMSGTSKISLLFNDEMQLATANQISIKKAGNPLAASDFTIGLSDDKKSLEIAFTAELNSVTELYEITLTKAVLDASGNELENPQIVEFNKTFDTTSNTTFASETGKGTMDGTSWENTKAFNPALLQSVAEGSTILVAQGSYKAGTSESDTFTLVNGVKIYGGFDTSDKDKPRKLEKSIFEGNLGNNTHTKQILTGTGLTSETVLDGFVIRNAKNNASGTSSNATKAAGLYLKNSSPKLVNLVFLNNKLAGNKSQGGAIYNDTSNPSIINSRFEGNSSGDAGGAISNHESNPSIINSVFKKNSSSNNGGAIANYATSNPNIINSLFIENSLVTTNGNGGAISNEESKPNISNSVFIGNKVGTNGNGGAIYNATDKDIPNISNSILWNNTKTGAQGSNNIHNDSNSNTIIQNSILNANSITGNNSGINPTDKNNTPETFVIESDGKITNATSQALIKDKGDNTLYLEVYDKINGTNGTSAIPATEKDLAGSPRLKGDSIDIGAYELQE